MKTVKKIAELKKEILLQKNQGKKIAFIPTMGALHDGHLALIKEAKKHANFIITSIFVNKKQFNDARDYEKYPRSQQKDAQKLTEAGANILFLPTHQEIYPQEIDQEIILPNFANYLCGQNRKGHFQGVYKVIKRFFEIINPDFAIFGKKDFQQYLLIKKMAQDLKLSTKIIGVETIREPSGLAKSSRNERLGEFEKKLAQTIYKILNEIKSEVKNGGDIGEVLQNKTRNFLKIGFEKIDYLEVRNEENLELVENFDPQKKCRIFVALYLDKVRLIDNLKI